jgi:hypothetical protein
MSRTLWANEKANIKGGEERGKGQFKLFPAGTLIILGTAI